MDISIEAIEAELAQAQAHAGRPVATEALMRAQILATVLAGGNGYILPLNATEEQRVQGAATLLRLDVDDLRARLSPTVGSIPFSGENNYGTAEDDDPFTDEDADEDEDDGLSRLGPNR